MNFIKTIWRVKMSQLTLFDGSQKFVIDKPIRLIELFGGYGNIWKII